MKLIPVIIVLVVFFNALFGVMICDDQYIINNPNIKNLTFNSANGLLDILTYEIIDFTGLPLSVQVMGFHFINILLHIIVCLLLFQFLELFFTETPSLLGTCLFAVLPVHTENVTWISGRAHLLVGLCFLAIFLLFYHKRYKLALVIFLLAILPGNTQTNIWVHIIPIVLMAYLLIYKEFKKILWVMPYFLISASIILFNWAEIVERIVLMTSSYGKSWINPWSSFIFSIFTHLRLAVFPVNLTIYHEPLIITPRFIVLGTVVFILLCLILPFLYKKAKPILFGVVIYVLFLLPTFSPVPIGWIIAERYIYTSSIFLCLLFAFLVEKFYKEVFIIFLIMGIR